MPDEPKFSLPGCALASAMNSFNDFAGTCAATIITVGETPTSVTWVKSSTGS